MKALLVIAAALAAAGLALWFASSLVPSRTAEFDMYLTVGNAVGFNVDTSAIFFGTVPPGGFGRRTIVIKHGGAAPVRVGFRAEGELAGIVSVSPESFTLGPGESRDVAVVVAVPESMPYGNYTGKLIVLYFD